MLTLYHGTPHADRILREGFDLAALRVSDVGDFGWGIYLTGDSTRARCHGQVLRCLVHEGRLARIANPYYLDGCTEVGPRPEDADRLLYDLNYDGFTSTLRTLTGSPSTREVYARLIRTRFLAEGYAGILTPYRGGEAVLFSLAPVFSISKEAT